VSPREILDDLTAARSAFFAALDATDPGSRERGIVGTWGARELVAHLGYWAGRAVEVIRAVEDGRIEDAYRDQPPVDDVNETVARVARDADVATVRKREAASVEALAEELRRIDARLLSAPLPSGAPLERLILEDGPEHYRGHAEELLRLGGGRAHD
jgi:uncharacterized protein YyaL (SSP411 family)